MTLAPALAAETLRCFAGLLMLGAALAKLRTLGRFRANLIASFEVPPAAARWLAPAVVLVELAAAIMALGLAVRIGLWLTLGLFSLFTGVLAYRYVLHGAVRCGCFGESGRVLSGLDLLRNGLVMMAVGVGIALQRAPTFSLPACLLAALACALAMRFHETVAALWRLAGRGSERAVPLQPGQALPPVHGRTLQPAVSQTLGPGQAAALLFLASGCSKCAGKRAELARLLPAAQQAGLAMWIVSAEPAPRLRRFLDGHYPLSQVLRLRRRDYARLNPLGASPAYLFVDHTGRLQASGLIGDDNWQALCAQLGAAQADEAA